MPLRAWRWRFAALLAGGVLIGAIARAEESAEKVDDPLVKLPAFVVEDSRNPIAWRYVAVPGLEVLSTCSRRDTEDFAEGYASVMRRFRQMLPESMTFTTSAPLTIVLVDERNSRISKEVVEQMVQAEAQRIISREVAGVTERATPGLSPGTPPPKRPAMMTEARFFPNLRLTDEDSYMFFVVMRSMEFDRHGLTLATDLVRFLLEHRVPALPRWYVEGMMTLYETTILREDQLVFTPFMWLSAADTRRLKKGVGVKDEFRPLWALFEHSASGTADEREIRRRDAQAAMFIRWCLQEPERARALWKFVDLATQGPPTPALFRECFGIGPDDIDLPAYYINQASGQRQSVAPDPEAELVRARSRTATEEDVVRICAEWERRAAQYVRRLQPGLASKYAEQLQHTLERGTKHQIDDPRFYATVGLANVEGGNDSAAVPALALAVAKRVDRPRAYYELARIKYAEARAQAAGPEQRIREPQAAEILGLIRSGSELSPPLLEAYLLASRVWLQSRGVPQAADLALLDRGVRLFPANVTLRQAASLIRGRALADRNPPATPSER